MSNKKIGNGFEAEFCEKLFQNGYWVHNLSQNAAGQPADVVAVKNGVPYLIDCKVCSGKVFSVSRIISIHAPREGGDRFKLSLFAVFNISIHAPREGGDES